MIYTKNNYFLDTNILVYAYNSDDGIKCSIATNLIKSEENDIIISTQVLNEFCSCLLKHKIQIQEIEYYLNEILGSFDVYQLKYKTTINAIKLKQKYAYSWWDSLLLTSAIENNCSVLYSEDMKHKQIIENTLEIINPFV